VVAVLDRLSSLPLRIVLEGARWLLLVILLAVALAVIYRVAPDRDAPKIKWVSVGALTATVLWLLASIGFTIYVANFGSYAKTYGALAGVIILMLWLWISCFAILLGATINAESEAQTIKDSTKGEPRPLGERQATKADSVPPGE
jgi:membrane protein